jgi:DNA-binding transcriptional MerR regulator
MTDQYGPGVPGGPHARLVPRHVAAAITGLTQDEVDYWARTGLVTPAVPTPARTPGRRSARRDADIDPLALLVVVELRRRGVRMRTVRQAMDRFDPAEPHPILEVVDLPSLRRRLGV